MASKGKTLTVLIVEDNDADAILLEHSLCGTDTASDFIVERACCLSEGKDLLAEKEFDAVLLDLSLPDSRGPETVSGLRANNQDVPVIVLSGLDDDSTAFAAIQAEAQDYLVKGQATGRQLEQAISHAIERQSIQNTFRDALVVSADMILVFDSEGQVVFRSQNAEEGLTVQDEEKVFELESTVSGTSSELALEGGRYVETRSVRLVWDRKPALFCALRDITGRKQAAERLAEMQTRAMQSQRLESLGNLAGGVAHEFNNLLTGILGNSDLLAQGWIEGEEVQEVAKDIRFAAQRAARLTKHLLGFARQGLFRNERYSLHDKLLQARELLTPVLNRTIKLEFDLQAKNPMVESDPDQMNQILLNLALNGQDAMPEGGLLSFHTRDDEFGRVVLEVRDRGTGIPEAIRERIFDPFFTTKPQNEGTGLGLAMVWGTASQHGWELDFDTEVGVGTCFRISFPAQVPATNEPSQGLVMVVDNESFVRDTLRRFLVQLNYEVLDFATGAEAIRASQDDETVIDVVILDSDISDMGVSDFFSRFRSLQPQASLISMTGESARAPDLEVDGFLFKPFDFKLLAGSLHLALSKKGHSSIEYLSSRLFKVDV